ncbi:MAG: hypothetical protein HUJ80_09560 [Firmicutes bacterium]|nr:hypothetical protein [Bacillota bacterium]
MQKIDRRLYEELYNWWKNRKERTEIIKYVQCTDTELTDATIHYLMQQIDKDDVHGEAYVALYSAEGFYRNMRKYYAEVSELYLRKPKEDEPIEKIIGDFPGTCGWLTLIIEGLENFTQKPAELKEMYDSFVRFARKGANVILVGSVPLEDVFRHYPKTFNDEGVIIVAPNGHEFNMGIYEQGKAPEVISIVNKKPKDKLDALEFYWANLTADAKKREEFNFAHFKRLYSDTLCYLLPRIDEDSLFREDINLLHFIAMFGFEKHVIADNPWEYESARNFARGLFNSIYIGDGEENCAYGDVCFWVKVEDKPENIGGIYITTGNFEYHMIVSSESAPHQMETLARAIRKSTFEGDEVAALCIIDNEEFSVREEDDDDSSEQ